MSNYVIVKAEFDWADEFDCECIFVGPREAWEKMAADANKVLEQQGEQEAGFGTNEELQIHGGDDWGSWNRCIKSVTDISDQTWREVCKAFGQDPDCKHNKNGWTFGTGDGALTLGERLEEEDD